jgi:hypothetical protein
MTHEYLKHIVNRGHVHTTHQHILLYFNISTIYIYKEECLFVCLSVRYAFSPCNSYRHQTFHDISLGPEEGRHVVGITKKGQEGCTWVKFHSGWVYCSLD